ncbi:invasion protein [Nocardia sp. ET3-3]|uniref:Invasion protein n=1 Tax=Nocardia terrae TaxID=2675851 RepID=A0A7K1V2B5_9NOCA|nr:DoxX family protein [Nocardia terrae]MVU80681.1 invasion protein [Nocardia terrae]
MRNVVTVLAGVLAAEFLTFGAAKLLAVPAMRERAGHLGFSTAFYRGIGVLEIAGGSGALIGLARPRVGAAAGIGLGSLMTGAGLAHRRNHDDVAALAPAVGTGLLVGAYLVALGARCSS